MIKRLGLICLLICLLVALTGCRANLDTAVPQGKVAVPTAFVPIAQAAAEAQAEEFFPEMIREAAWARLNYTPTPAQAEAGMASSEQTLTDPEALRTLESWLAGAQLRETSSNCPFGFALLTLGLADGREVTLDAAVDDCMIYRVGEAYYNYMPAALRERYDIDRPHSDAFSPSFPVLGPKPRLPKRRTDTFAGGLRPFSTPGGRIIPGFFR